MRAVFNYDCTPRFMHPCTLNASRYTGKERDTESGLDYFGARYYGSSMGRFMSPDPSSLEFADPSNPQSLNLYSYAQNNPLTNVDPTGLDCVYYNDAGSGVESIDRNSSSGECGSNGGDYVNGRIQSIQTFGSGGDTTFGFRSSDSSNNHLTYANAPGSQSDVTSCSGNCDIATAFFSLLIAHPVCSICRQISVFNRSRRASQPTLNTRSVV